MAAQIILSLMLYLKLELQGAGEWKKTSRLQQKACDCNREF